MMDTSPVKRANVGILHSGHRRYWGQFEGSREETIDGAKRLEAIIRKSPVNVVMSELVDYTEESFKAGKLFETGEIDFLFIYIHSYVASGYWLPGIMHLNVPIVLVSLPLDWDMEDEYITGTAVRRGGVCALPEAYSALVRCGKKPLDVIIGGPEGDEKVEREIDEWCRIANVLRTFKYSVFGFLGHVYDGMLDMNFDPTSFTGAFGAYIRMLEMCELADYVQNASDDEVKAKIAQMHETFDFMDRSGDPITRGASDEDIEWAARCAVGLDQLVTRNNLDGLCYYYEGENNLYERIGSNLIIGNTLMTTHGIAMAGEADMKTCVAMKTTGALGHGGSFAELSIYDAKRNEFYVGHDGPHDIRITDSKPRIRGLSLYHGKKGRGIAVEFGIRKGPMSMVSLAVDNHDTYKFVVAEVESMPGRLPEIANSVTRAHAGRPAADFLRDWSMSGVSHHTSLCVGHAASVMRKLGKALNMEVQVIETQPVENAEAGRTR